MNPKTDASPFACERVGPQVLSVPPQVQVFDDPPLRRYRCGVLYIAIGSGLEPDTEVGHREIGLLSLSKSFSGPTVPTS